MRTKLLYLAAIAAVPFLPAQTEPSSSSTDWWRGETFTGDWWGSRNALRDSGVDFFAYYNAIVAGNPVGGRQPQVTYADDFYYGATFDLEKIIGWQGALFTISGINRDGSTIRPDVGSQYDPMQLVGGQKAFLYGVNLEQKLFDNMLSVKLGRMAASDDFATSPLYAYYLNNGLAGNIRAVLFDTKFSAYPFPVWGGRIRIDPSREFNAMAGIFQVSDRMFDPNYHGTDFSIRSGDGVLLLGQLGWTPELFKKPVRGGDPKSSPEMRGLPGHYFAGVWWSGWDYPQFGRTAKAPNSYGFYAHADQMVYQEEPGSAEGLTLFATLTVAPQQNIAILPVQASGGAIYQGLIPSREQDRAIFGFIYGKFSGDYADSIQAGGGGDPDAELVLEWGYRVQVNEWAYIQPDLQWIVTPGGTGKIPNGLVLGAQFGVRF